MTTKRLAAFLLAAFALTACGGGGTSTPPVSLPANGGTTAPGSSGPDLSANAPHNTAAAAGAAAASLSITIPQPKAGASSTRRPKYLTSTTMGIDLQAYQNGTYSGYVFYPLSALQTYCTSTATGFSCNLPFQAPVGSAQILVHTYDNTTVATSNILSVASPTVTIKSGAVNNLAIQTLPIAAGVTPSNSPHCPLYGSPSTQTFTYTAYDADGGDLTGLTLGNTVTFADANPADTSPGYSVTPATITAGSGTLTFQYSGSDAQVASFTSTFSLASNGMTNVVQRGGGIFPVGTPAPHMIYISDSTNNAIYGFDSCGTTGSTPLVFNLPGGTNPIEAKYDRSSTGTGHARLFVLGANNTLVWLDATSAPGTVLQTVALPGVPHHLVDSSTSAFLWVTYGVNALGKYSINEAGPTLGFVSSVNLSAPRGFNLEGTGNDMLVANTGAASVLSVNPATLATDGTVAIAGPVNKISGPNGPTPNCALAASTNGMSISAVSVGATPWTPTQIGASLPLGGTPLALSFFPPNTPGSGTIGFGSTTGIVALAGSAAIVSCTGASFSQLATWTSFMSNPTAMVPSTYASTANSSLVWVVGVNNGSPTIQGYNAAVNAPIVNSGGFPPTATLTDVTVGP